MREPVLSILLGTSGLTVAFLVSLMLAVRRPPLASAQVPDVQRAATFAVAGQAVHFVEELWYGFHVRFPETLGLSPWPRGFFVTFNVTWLLIWMVAIATLARFRRLTAVALWFLAIASIANGVVHPVLSIIAGGYFPGLWSSFVVGMLGVVLVRRLASASR